MFSDLVFRLRALFGRKSMDSSMDQELRFHFDRQMAKHIQAGLSSEEARRRVRLEFGGSAQIEEECRDARGTRTLEALWQDLRYAFRTLRKNPGFTGVALITLALAIGANTAIFSAVYSTLLRPLPFADPDRLVAMNETHPTIGIVSVSYPNFLDWREQSHAFSDMAVMVGRSYNLPGIEQPEAINGMAVSANFLPLVGTKPLLGRDFRADDEKPGAEDVVMLSYPLWQSHFNGSRDAIGRSVALNSRSYRVIAVLPSDFRTTRKIDVLESVGRFAANQQSDSGARGNRGETVVVGRLAAGATLASARSEMEGIAARLAAAYPQFNNRFGITLRPIRELFVGSIRPAMLVLFTAVTFVLLIACANVANLFLMRAAGRTREIALRMAIGASNGRIIQQMLVESFVVASLGGIAGLGLAFTGMQAMTSLIPASAISSDGLTLNTAVLLFALAATVLSAVAFGLAPAMQSVRASAHSRLKEGGKSNTGSVRQNRGRTMLAVAEVALSAILLIGAGLMLKSVYRLMAVDPGFRSDNLLVLDISLSPARYPSPTATFTFWNKFLSEVRALPGVESAAIGGNVPLTDSHSRGDITIEGQPVPEAGSFPHPDRHEVSTGYLRTLGVRLLSGRDFTDADSATAPLVALINARLAREHFNGQDPIGKRFLHGRPDPKDKPDWITIVGVVDDTRMYGLANPSRLEIYWPLAQRTPRAMSLIVKSRLESGALSSSIRGVLTSLDRNQPITYIRTMDEIAQSALGSRRVTLILLGLFSALALLLAAIGIYGVISYSVAQRTQEIGIRIALGASRGTVVNMVLLQGGRIVVAGLMVGLLAAFSLTRYLEELLFAVSPADPATFAMVAGVLAAVALLACYIPARRTLRVDPMIALRSE
jgi:putative ABC transport system permease protein